MQANPFAGNVQPVQDDPADTYTHPKTFTWSITTHELQALFSAAQYQGFKSQSFRVGSFIFHGQIYPNGTRNQILNQCTDSFDVSLFMEVMPSNVSYIWTKYKIYCPQTETEWKSIALLHKTQNRAKWRSNIMHMDDAKKHLNLTFICTIDLLSIIYIKNSIALRYIGTNIYNKSVQIHTTSSYKWCIDDAFVVDEFLTYRVSKYLFSEDFGPHSNWCLICAPNGESKEGNIRLALQLLMLPSGISKVGVTFTLKCNYYDINLAFQRDFSYHQNIYGWDDGVIMTKLLWHQIKTTRNSNTHQSLEFFVNLEIIKVFNSNDHEIPKRSWDKYGIISAHKTSSHTTPHLNVQCNNNTNNTATAHRNHNRLNGKEENDMSDEDNANVLCSTDNAHAMGQLKKLVLSEIKSMKKVLNTMTMTMDTVPPQQTTMTMNMESIPHNEYVRYWLSQIGMKQYIDNYLSNGFDALDIVMGMNEIALQQINITLAGHKLKILNETRKLRTDRNHYESVITNAKRWYTNRNSLKTMKTLQSVITEGFKPRYDAVDMVQLQINDTDTKCSNDNEKYCALHPRSVKAFKLLRRIRQNKKYTHWNIEGDEQFGEYFDAIIDYLNLNGEYNPAPFVILERKMNGDAGDNEHNKRQLRQRHSGRKRKRSGAEAKALRDIYDIGAQNKVIEECNIKIHSRISALNGQKGLRAKVDIASQRVIGQYLGIEYLESEYEDIYHATFEGSEHEIYSFAEKVETWSENSKEAEFEFDNVTLKKKKKKRKLNSGKSKEDDAATTDEENAAKLEHHIDRIVIDGLGLKRVTNECKLIYMNDCRKSLRCAEPNDDDQCYWNVEFVSVYVNGWPQVFAITRRDVAKNEELAVYYGEEYEKILSNRKRWIERKKQNQQRLARLLSQCESV